MRKSVVTGAAGFVGSHLVAALLARGEAVVGFDDLERGRASRLPSGRSFEFYEQDVRDARGLAERFRGASVVYHLAAIATVARAQADPRAAFDVNVAGSVHVLEAAREARVPRVVLASSREVYGNAPTLPVAEEARISPANVYGHTKAMMEHAAGMFASLAGRGGPEIRIARLANVYGPGDHGRVLPIWIANAREGRPLVVYGDPSRTLDLVHVDETVRALIALGTEQVAPSPLNVGSGEGITLGELAALVAARARGAKVEYAAQREGEVDHFVADVRKLAAFVGSPRKAPRRALEAFVADELARS